MENEGTEGQRGEPAANIDDLFDYDFGLDEILQGAQAVSTKNAAGQSAAPDASGLGLGVDEEVKVTKKRQPVAKLDESRLLSQPGIPKLRRTAKQKLHFKGKGHEFSDAARLLNFYQLWLDDLFPRAKFVDGLAMIEKLGHSKRLQTMRREWIEAEKPKPQTNDVQNALQANQTIHSPSDKPETGTNNLDPTSTEQFQTDKTARDEMQGSSENRSTWPQSTRRPNDTDQSLFMSDDEVGHHANDQDAPDDDELDALLREQEDEVPATKTAPIVTGSKLPGFGYDDELEAMMELDALDPIAT